MLCDSLNLHKQKLVKLPKPLASKMAAVKKVGQKNGEVGLLVDYLFCAIGDRPLVVKWIDFQIQNNGRERRFCKRFSSFL